MILAPDVYVNASVAPDTFPDRVVQRVLGKHKGESIATEWILARVASILGALPDFKQEAVTQQITLIRSLVKVISGASEFEADNWQGALIAAAKAANVKRVVTDHPDLLAIESADGVEFTSSEAWLFEVTTPPPIPN